MKRKKSLKYYLYMAAFMPLSWFPLPVLYLFSDLLRLIFQHMIHYRRRVVRENLSSCYPNKTEAELRAIEAGFYRQFCDNIVESVKLFCISDRTLRKRIEVVDAHLVEQAADRGKSIILFLGHYCNWEWVPAITMHYDRPRVSAQLYKPLHDRAFDQVMLKMRSRFPSICIEKDRAFREMLRLRRDYGPIITGFIADNRTSARDTGHYTEFLRHRTWFYPGGEEIGNRIDAEYLYLDVEKTGRGHYRLQFKPIVADPADTEPYPVTRRYLAMLQDTIDRAPAYWLWSHRRWIGDQTVTYSPPRNPNK
ncbi:MAG: lysophospholipid acyltransferase family protein [Bacteroides sp.]|nr:lysophospholipid acyltransferase family protein [Bacteroides sp.]MCM1413501.1 lysophospholipid acyltransferase family protein [Bacteroides sp.]MCM1471055.1 lysophospholipid acyltransferase family protein [Bacteroides sp.]